MKKLHMKLTTLTLASALFLTSFADVPAANAIKKKLRLSKNSLTLQTGQKSPCSPTDSCSTSCRKTVCCGSQ